MGYYIRVLSTSAECVPQALIQEVLRQSGFPADLEWLNGSNGNWNQFILSHTEGLEIANIERSLVETNSIGESELIEFQEEVKDAQPKSAAQWLSKYFKKVKTVYSFQILSGAYKNDGWNAIYIVQDIIFAFAPAIGQADAEGFTKRERRSYSLAV
jgi:hypothetical protein